MADTIHVPGIGGVHKPWVFAGAALVVGIVGMAYLHSRSSASASTATAPNDGSAVGTSLDGASQGADSYAGAAGSALPQFDAYGNPIQYDAYGQPVYASATTTGPPTTNQGWVQAGIDYLTNTLGYAPQTAAQALADYTQQVNGGHLSQSEANIVNLVRSNLGELPNGSLPVQVAATAATTVTAVSNYVGAQWKAGQRVVIGGTPGVADTWNVLAKKILSSNTYNNPANIARAAAALKAANPALAKKYKTAVPNTQAIVIPKIPGLN